MKNQKLSQQTWFIILLLWLFFPAGLFFMWKNQKFHIAVRSIITALYGFAILSVVVVAIQSISYLLKEPSSESISTTNIKEYDVSNDSYSNDSNVDAVLDTTNEVQKVEEIPSTNTTTETTSQESSSVLYESDLTAGNYTVGIDIPAGTYNLTAVSGTGTVYSTNSYDGGVNQSMSSTNSDITIREFNNANFSNGDEVNITSTLTLRFTSSAADTSSMQIRTNPLTKSVELSSGEYQAGVDFPAGVYDVIAVSNSGNVSSSNMFSGGLNETMGASSDGYNIQEYKNANLSEGETLTISDVTIQLVPSK